MTKPLIITPKQAVSFRAPPAPGLSIDAPARAAAAAHVFEPDDLINGRYRVERLLGSGGMGSVYLVADTLKSGEPVALKMLQGSELSPEQVALLKNEFAVMTHLAHPNLASVYDFEPLHGSNAHFFTMEYVGGLPFDAATGNLGWHDILDLMVQVCRGLSYMHSRSIIHFDLKPANIMVTADRRAKVLDFGLAGARAYKSGAGDMIVTPAYMAPELAHSASTADHRVDLYSLGIILYQLLTGELPFPGPDVLEVLRAHCAMPLVFDEQSEKDIPAWLRRLVIRMCAKEPADRFPTANAIIDAINREGGFTYEVETRKTRESYLLSGRFVARQEEFQALLEHAEKNLGDGADGKTACFAVGVSGVGKSRLMREVRHHLQLSRRSFVETNCYDGSLSEFAPMVEAVRHVVALVEAEGRTQPFDVHGSELAKLDQQLAREKGWAPSAPSQTPEAERQRIIQHVAEFMLDATQVQPFVLYVNDLQWALPGTVDILSHLMHQAAERRKAGEPVHFSLLGSYREDEVESRPVADLLATARERGFLSEVLLHPLSREHVGQLLGSMLGIEAPPAAFVARVHDESGGNPYFVEEIMRTLVENGSVYLENGTWATNQDTHRLELPHSVADALLKRFALLDEPHRYLIDLMAVHGQPLPLGVLQRIVGGTAPELQQQLNTLVNRRIAIRIAEPETAYRVVHDRLREAVHDAIPANRRRELHGQLAKGLAGSYAERQDEVLYDLARHYWEAYDAEHALEFSLRAAEKAHREYANDFGIVLYQRVLELLPEGEQEQVRRQALENLGEMSFLTGAYDNALQCYDEVFAASTDPLTQARLRRKEALVHFARGQLYDARGKLLEAVELLGAPHPNGPFPYARMIGKNFLVHLLHRYAPFLTRRENDPETRARLAELSAINVRLVYVYYFIHPVGLLLPALVLANTSERIGESAQLCHAHSALGVVYGSLALFRGARHYGEKALELSRQMGFVWHLGQAHEFRGMTLFFAAKLDEAMVELTQAEKILRECGDLFELEVCYIHLSYCLIFQGRYDKALTLSTQGYQLVKETDALQAGKLVWNHVSFANAKLGDLEAAIQEMKKTIRTCDEQRDMLDSVACRVFLGDTLLIAGQIDEAIECLETGRRIREEHGIIQDYSAGVYAYLVRALWEKFLRTGGRSPEPMSAAGRRRMRELSRKALWLARLSHPNYLSPGYIARGLSLWLDGRTQAARRHFRRGLDIARQQRADMWLAEGCFEAGRCLLLTTRTHSEGIRYLHQAEQLFDAQGYKPYLQRTRELLKAEGGLGRTGRM